ncbi:MAG: hypothetical protein QW687_00170 [Candidatus Hadarchaeales archaeon]
MAKVVLVKPSGRKGLLTYLRREIELFLDMFPYEKEELEKAMKERVIVPARPYTKDIPPLVLILLLATLTEREEQ